MRISLRLVIAAILLMASLSVRPVSARDTLKYAGDYVIPAQAVVQSNAFAIGQEMSEPVMDGWQHEGFLSIFDREGKISPELSASLVVDRPRDPVLRDTIEEARRLFSGLPARQRAAALTRFSHELFTPEGMSDDQLSDWDDSFGNQHRGERILLGEYILQKKGVCLEEATLLKVLADELNIPATLIFGFDDNVGHVWTTMRMDGHELVFDPAQVIVGTAAGDIDGHDSIRQIYGKDFQALEEAIAAHEDIEQEKYADAERRLKLLAETDARVLGNAHPAYVLILTRLANVYRLDGKDAQAEPYLKEAVDVCIRARGARHQEVADCLNDLAGLERSLKRTAESERLYKRAIAIYQHTLGRNDASVADPLYNLADLYLEEKKFAPAEKLFKRALLIYSQTKGTADGDTIDTMNKLSDLHRGLEENR